MGGLPDWAAFFCFHVCCLEEVSDRIIHNSYTIPTTDNNLRKLYDSKKAKDVIDSLG